MPSAAPGVGEARAGSLRAAARSSAKLAPERPRGAGQGLAVGEAGVTGAQTPKAAAGPRSLGDCFALGVVLPAGDS